MEDLMLALNLKNSMKYVKKLSHLSYNIILCFSLSPSGISELELTEMFNHKYSDFKIVQEREFSITKISHTENIESSY